MFEASPSGENASSALHLEDLDASFCPSYAIVQEQMRDLIMIQENAIGNLAKKHVETLNASRDIFNATVQSKEEELDMLQKLVAEKHVTRVDYEKLVERLKKESESHSDTQTALQNISRELKQSHDVIKTMQQDRETTEVAFKVIGDDLRQQLTEAQAKNNLLQSKLNEQLMLCEQQQEEIVHLQQQMAELQRRQQSQTVKHLQQIHETEVEKQQEAYMQRMMSDREAKHRKRLK